MYILRAEAEKVESNNTVITLQNFSRAYPLAQSYPTLWVSCPSGATISLSGSSGVSIISLQITPCHHFLLTFFPLCNQPTN